MKEGYPVCIHCGIINTISEEISKRAIKSNLENGRIQNGKVYSTTVVVASLT